MSKSHIEPAPEALHEGGKPSNTAVSDRVESGPSTEERHSSGTKGGPNPDLDRGLPDVTVHDLRRMNRNALGLLAGVVLLLGLIAFWLFRSAGTHEAIVEIPNEETVTVPDAPMAGPVAPPEQGQPIELTPQSHAPTAIPIEMQASPESTGEAIEPRKPTLLERRIAAAEAGAAGSAGSVDTALQAGYTLPAATGAPAGAGPGIGGPTSPFDNHAYSMTKLPEVSRATPLQHPDRLLRRGTFIRCVLESRIITDMPGFTSCIVTEPLYSFTGKKLLLPKGSKVMGKYDMEPNGPRVAVVWDRIVTPDGIDVNMASPGVDTLGGAGHPGRYSAHWGSRIGAALLISLFSDAFKYAAAKHGPPQTAISNGVVTQSPFESNTAETVQQLANEAVRRQANRPATVTINQGTVLAIYVARDVDFTDVIAP